MAVSLIDDALYAKIQSWVIDPKMKILKPSETLRLFQTIADSTNDDEISLPIIALSRESEIEIQQTNKRALSFSGHIAGTNTAKDKILVINAIPIEVNYQLDIYTKGYAEGDEYLRNFIFNFINYPKMTVTIPYNGANYQHDANVRVESTVSDTSDIPQRLFSGQFTRWTLKLNVDDCYLFSIPVQSVPSVELNTVEIAEKPISTAQVENIETGEVTSITYPPRS